MSKWIIHLARKSKLAFPAEAESIMSTFVTMPFGDVGEPIGDVFVHHAV